MKKYICETCGWIYDPAVGDPDGGIEPGTVELEKTTSRLWKNKVF